MMRKRPGLVLVSIAGFGLLLITAAVAIASRHEPAQQLPVLATAPDYALIDQFERPAHSGDVAGTVVVASFIYTNCRDICPVVTVRMRGLQERLQEQGLLDGRVSLLSFSVDPARDTPAVLRAYAEQFRADPTSWRFLTGPKEVLIPLIVDGFYLGAEALPPAQTGHGDHDAGQGADYEVMHSGRIVLIDQQGRVRAYYDAAAVDLEQAVRDIRALLGRG